MRKRGLATALTALCAALAPVRAEETPIVVRVLAHDAKFVGDGVGGAAVTIRDAATGAILAEGVAAGDTGDTDLLMRTPWARGAALSTPGAAVFAARLDLERPTRLTVEARGPLGHPDAALRASREIWGLPGKPLEGGDGIVLTLSGFVVEIDAVEPGPAAAPFAVAATVTMMCGCPLTPGGLWDADRVEVEASLAGRTAQLAPGSEESRFAGTLTVPEPGAYDLVVTAYDPQTNNTGVGVARLIAE